MIGNFELLATIKVLIRKTIWYYKSYPSIVSDHDQCRYYRECNINAPIFFLGFCIAIIASQAIRILLFLLDRTPIHTMGRLLMTWTAQDLLLVPLNLYYLMQYNNSKAKGQKNNIILQRSIYKKIRACIAIPTIGIALTPLVLPEKSEMVEYVWLVLFLFQLQACTWMVDGVLHKVLFMGLFNTIFCGISIEKGYFTTSILGRMLAPILVSAIFFYTFERYKKENFIFRNMLKQQKLMYEKFLGKVQDPMIIVGQSKLHFCNEAARTMLGVSDTNFFATMDHIMSTKGTTLYESVQGAFQERSTEVVKEKYSFYDYESDFIGPSKILLVTLVPSLTFSGEQILALALHDATEELLQEEKRVESKYKNMLLISLSHELLTPLNAFEGFLRTAKEFMSTSVAKDMWVNAKGAWCYLKNKIGDVLDYVQLMSEEFCLHCQPFSLTEFVKYLRKTTWYLLGASRRKVRLEFSLDKSVNDEFIGDRGRLEQVLFNFLINAVQHIISGTISLAIRHPGGDKKLLEFAVSDTGCGMSPEFVGTLFELRTQAPSTQRSTGLSGLGLTISKMICNRMGADIKVVSEVNKGSTFSFILSSDLGSPHTPPSVPSEGVKAKSCRNLSVIIRKGRIKHKPVVMVVDDNKVNRHVVKAMTQKMGIWTEEAENGKVAVEKVVELQEDPQVKSILILMDINMPVMDGIEATIEIGKVKKKEASQIHIVALTAFSAESERAKCIEVGMEQFISKPITKDKLQRLLKSFKLLP